MVVEYRTAAGGAALLRWTEQNRERENRKAACLFVRISLQIKTMPALLEHI